MWNRSIRPSASSTCCPDQNTSVWACVACKAAWTGPSLMISGRVPMARSIRISCLVLSRCGFEVFGKVMGGLRPDDRFGGELGFTEISRPGPPGGNHVDVEGKRPAD